MTIIEHYGWSELQRNRALFHVTSLAVPQNFIKVIGERCENRSEFTRNAIETVFRNFPKIEDSELIIFTCNLNQKQLELLERVKGWFASRSEAVRFAYLYYLIEQEKKTEPSKGGD